eukprot:14157185-Ditylum_brightwellii.AAC.1
MLMNKLAMDIPTEVFNANLYESGLCQSHGDHLIFRCASKMSPISNKALKAAIRRVKCAKIGDVD